MTGANFLARKLGKVTGSHKFKRPGWKIRKLIVLYAQIKFMQTRSKHPSVCSPIYHLKKGDDKHSALKRNIVRRTRIVFPNFIAQARIINRKNGK